MKLPTAAQQTWDAMPWWQKALVGYGKGASDVLRKDYVSPALRLSHLTGLYPDLHKQFDARTEELNRPYESLKGIAPQVLSDIGSTAPLLPAGMGVDAAVEKAVPEVAGGGLMALLRKYAPMSAGGATVGGLEPDNRAAGALMGALAPPGAGALMHVAPEVGMPLMNLLHRMGALSGKGAFNVLDAPIQAKIAKQYAQHYVPKAIRSLGGPPGSVVADVAKERVKAPVRSRLQRTLFQTGGAGGGEDPGQPSR